MGRNLTASKGLLFACCENGVLITDDVLFIHIPKTGGMSVQWYLLNNLRGQLTVSIPPRGFDNTRRSLKFADIDGRLNFIPGKRHETLAETRTVLKRRGLEIESFKLILAVIRNPYDLEVSHFEYLKQPDARTHRPPGDLAMQLACQGDFEEFAEKAAYYGRNPAVMERYYTLDGKQPGNMRIVRFEHLAAEIGCLVEPYSLKRFQMEHHNRTRQRENYRAYLTPRAEQAIYVKYRYLFEFYEREGTLSALGSPSTAPLT